MLTFVLPRAQERLADLVAEGEAEIAVEVVLRRDDVVDHQRAGELGIAGADRRVDPDMLGENDARTVLLPVGGADAELVADVPDGVGQKLDRGLMEAVARGPRDGAVEGEVEIRRQPQVARVDRLLGPQQRRFDLAELGERMPRRRERRGAALDVDAELVELLDVGNAVQRRESDLQRQLADPDDGARALAGLDDTFVGEPPQRLGGSPAG